MAGRTGCPCPVVAGFYEPRSGSIQYVVSDPATRACAIIDPVLDFDEKSGSVATRSADAILAYIAEQGLKVEWILDTHPHADHFSAAHYLKDNDRRADRHRRAHRRRAEAVGRHLQLRRSRTDGSQWDHLFADGERFRLGEMEGRVIFSPGHTLCFDHLCVRRCGVRP